MKMIIIACLVLGLAMEGQAQTSVLICRNGICTAVSSTPTAAPIAPVAPVPAMVHERKSNTKAIVLTAAVAAVGTWLLVKVFRKKESN